MNHIINKKITCNSIDDCENTIIGKLEKKFNCKLKALTESDSVNGYVSILHQKNDHIVTIEFYDKNQNPNIEHKSTFKKLEKIPTMKQCKECLS